MQDPASGAIWHSDGTSAGTLPFALSNQVFFTKPIDQQGHSTLLQSAWSAATTVPVPGVTGSGTPLWQSDGTAQGTAKVLDLPALPATMELDRMWAAGGLLFYTGIDRNAFVEQIMAQ